MAKFFAFKGIGFLSRTLTGGNTPNVWRKWPYAIIMGPSGQLAQLLPPSGFAGKTPDVGGSRTWHDNEGVMNHSPLAWKRNQLFMGWSSTNGTGGSMRYYSWSPKKQQGPKLNTTGAQFDTNTTFNNIVIEDGQNWTCWNITLGARDFIGVVPIHDAIYWFRLLSDTGHFWGLHKGNTPLKSGSNWFPKMGNYGNPGEIGDEGWSRLPGSNRAGGQINVQAGVDFRAPGLYSPTTVSHNICEVVLHRDTMYVATQTFVAGASLGNKGCFIHHDFGNDSLVAAGAITGYTQRNSSNVLKARARSLAIHDEKLWMLDNDGKIYEIRPGGVILRANIANLSTPWASGIVGGAIDKVANTGDWPGASAYRPLLRSFNGQLHAFLNFNTSYKIARGKGNINSKLSGAGVAWFTSHDGINWYDRSHMLPSSGIQTPSGNAQPLSSWLNQISPYRHSAFTNTNYPSGYGPKAPQKNFLNQSAPLTRGAPAQPSGFTQKGFLPFWASGSFVEDPGKIFNQLNIPLAYGALSGYLFPTIVAYPSGYAFLNPSGEAYGYLPQASGGVWRPVHGGPVSAWGPSGYDYTGCANYHIGGYVDLDDPKDKRLRLSFSRNFVGTSTLSLNRQQPTLFYDLTESSGFIQRNHAWNAGTICGYTPINLYNPEIIVPSGDVYNRNPKVDTVNKRVSIKYKASDYQYWEPINVKLEYSINRGITWATCTTSGSISNVSTGSQVVDPSGRAIHSSQEHELFWLYDHDISKNTLFPHVLLRIRGEID